MANEKYTVVFNKEINMWQIKKSGAVRASGNFVTKEAALAKVRVLSKNQDIGVTVKKKDGKFGKHNI